MNEIDLSSPLFGGMSVDSMITFLREHYGISDAEAEEIRVKGHVAQQRFAEQWPACKEFSSAR